jgi:hypothetical protein
MLYSKDSLQNLNIKVPTEEENRKQRKADRRNFIGGLFTGFIVFGLIGSRIFWYGFDEVAMYTWLALGFGVISFGFLAKWFGLEFWQTLFRNITK